MSASNNHETGELLPHNVKALLSEETERTSARSFQIIYDSWIEKFRNKLRIRNITIRLFLGEFLGTFVLITPHGNIVTTNFGCGLAVAMGVFAAGGASGGHINPAFSLAQAVRGALPWRHLPAYWTGQYLGSIVASAAVYFIYYESIVLFDGGIRQTSGINATAGIWATYPQAHVSTFQAFLDQFFATGLLLLMALALIDPRNMEVPKCLIPIGIGMIVTAILTSFEYNCGAALNPARDLGPRIFTSLAGWGIAPFAFRNWNWFWVPILGPHLGAIAGGLVYDLCAGIHLPEHEHGNINENGFVEMKEMNTEKEKEIK